MSLAESAKKTVLCLIQAIKDSLCITDQEESDMEKAYVAFSLIHPDVILNLLVLNLLPVQVKNSITSRDISYFKNNMFLFKGLPKNKVEYYQKILVDKSRVSDENMEMLWAYFNTLLLIAETSKKN